MSQGIYIMLSMYMYNVTSYNTVKNNNSLLLGTSQIQQQSAWSTKGKQRDSLRVLPKYGEEGASWDEETFEPNNSLANAYAISVGRGNVLTSEIEQRNGNYSTTANDAFLLLCLNFYTHVSHFYVLKR